jgi:hypothetical protein
MPYLKDAEEKLYAEYFSQVGTVGYVLPVELAAHHGAGSGDVAE